MSDFLLCPISIHIYVHNTFHLFHLFHLPATAIQQDIGLWELGIYLAGSVINGGAELRAFYAASWQEKLL